MKELSIYNKGLLGEVRLLDQVEYCLNLFLGSKKLSYLLQFNGSNKK